MASYPTSVKTFTTKNPGDKIASADVNDLQAEVNAIEAGLLNGTATLNSSASTLASLSVTGGSTLNTLNVTGVSTLASLSVAGGSTFAGGMTSTRWNSTGAASLAMNSTVYCSVTAQQIVNWPTQPRAGAFNSAAQSLTSNTQTIVTFDSDDAQMTNIGGMHSTSANSGRFTIQTGGDGAYLLASIITFATAAAGSVILTRFQKNGVDINPGVQSATTGQAVSIAMTQIANAVATDFFTVTAYQNIAGSLNIGGGGATVRSQMYVAKIG